MLPKTYFSDDPYHPGFRFLTGFHGRPLVGRPYEQAMQAAELHRVTHRIGDDVHTIDDSGLTHVHVKRHGRELEVADHPAGPKRIVIWDLRLPQLHANYLRIMADALSNYRSGRPFLLLCRTRTDDGMLCNRIQCSSAALDARDGTTDQGRTVGNAFISDRPILLASGCDRNRDDVTPLLERRSSRTVEPDVGDLLLAIAPEWVATEAPDTIREANLFRIATDIDEQQVGNILPAPLDDARRMISSELPFAGLDEVHDGISRAYARLEPNDVIAISIPQDDGDVHVAAVSHRGIRLYDSDNLTDDLWGTSLEPGVWIGEDVTWFDCGDDGAEWEASWRRATPADLESYGIDAAEIADHWNDAELLRAAPQDIEAMIREARGPNPVESAPSS